MPSRHSVTSIAAIAASWRNAGLLQLAATSCDRYMQVSLLIAILAALGSAWAAEAVVVRPIVVASSVDT